MRAVRDASEGANHPEAVGGDMSDSGSSSARLESLRQRLTRILADAPPLGAVIQIDLGAGGQLLVDARNQPPSVSVGSGAAACTLSMSTETLERVLAGDVDSTTAFMQGEMTIFGDVELAVRLNALLTGALSGANGGPASG